MDSQSRDQWSRGIAGLADYPVIVNPLAVSLILEVPVRLPRDPSPSPRDYWSRFSVRLPYHLHVKRGLTKLAMLLLLGAAINVAVAWGCALLIRDHRLHGEAAGSFLADRYGGPRVWITSLERTGAVRYVFQFDDSWPFNVSERDRHLFPKWSRGAEPRRIDTMKEIVPHEPIDDVLVEDARGWPLLGVHCEFVIARAVDNQTLYVQSVSGGIPVRKGSNAPVAPGTIEIRSRILYATALPVRPIWPGFALNTLFYAAACWLLCAAPFAARRMNRRRRGLCVRCGYDLRGRLNETAACPECGGGETMGKAR